MLQHFSPLDICLKLGRIILSYQQEGNYMDLQLSTYLKALLVLYLEEFQILGIG